MHPYQSQCNLDRWKSRRVDSTSWKKNFSADGFPRYDGRRWRKHGLRLPERNGDLSPYWRDREEDERKWTVQFWGKDGEENGNVLRAESQQTDKIVHAAVTKAGVVWSPSALY
ncbi:hypothetical protein Ancab_006154 [Ancistrocladus abbreviatus]